MPDLYYSASPDQSRYLRRMDRLGAKRNEAVLFATAAVGLGLGINLLASVLYATVPQYLALPLTVAGLLVLIVIAYLTMWRDMDSRESAPVLLISERAQNNPPKLSRVFALVSGGGFGITLEASQILIAETGPITTDQDRDRIEFLTAETLLWWLICSGFREGWYFPDLAAENLNVSWVEGATPTTGTVELDLCDAVGADYHPFGRLRDRYTKFLAPHGTQLAIKREETQRTSIVVLTNPFATVRCLLEWQGKGFPHFVIGSPWVPRGKGQDQVVFRLVVDVSYSLRSKMPFYGKSVEHMRWAERVADYLISEVSFRSFEHSQDRSWRNKDVESVERLLGVSRWDY